MTSEAVKQQGTNKAAWAACDSFRGGMPPKSKADNAFVSHKVEVALEKDLAGLQKKIITLLKQVPT